MKKLAIVATTAALTLSLGAFAGCAPTPVNDPNAPKPEAKEISTETVTTETEDGKTLVMYAATELPVDHAGRTIEMCASCHGPEGVATTNPEDHYVNDSYDSGEINDMHTNCLACHAIDEEAVAAAEAAAAEEAANAEKDADGEEAPAEVDAPDCAPCHGDAHKPGEENPHGYPTAGAASDDADDKDAADDKSAADDKTASDDKDAADEKADEADSKATDDKKTSSSSAKADDSKSSTSSSSKSSTSSSSKSDDSKSSSSSSSSAKASDAPDCAPCHGDAHKPGEENPHGY